MAYYSTGYQYETSPRKLQPEHKQTKKTDKKSTTKNKTSNNKHKNTSSKQQFKAILYIVIGFAILFAISYRNSLITASFNEREDLKKQLSTLQKENAQTEISIQTSLNLTNIEKSASSMLGMKKLGDSQKVYVSLPKEDYVETASEQVVVTEEQNWFEKIINKITDLMQ